MFSKKTSSETSMFKKKKENAKRTETAQTVT